MTGIRMLWRAGPTIHKGKHRGVRTWTCAKYTIVHNPANERRKQYLMFRTDGGYLFQVGGGFSRSLDSAKHACRRDAERRHGHS